MAIMEVHENTKKVFSGIWQNNPALVQLLGLCPLLGVSNTVVNALGLGIATIMVLVASNIIISSIRKQIPVSIRLPIFVMLIAACTSSVELLMQAYAYSLYQSVGLFIPLIVTNCLILGRAEAFASRKSVFLAAFDGFAMGFGFLVVLLLLGVIRELLGQGTLFGNMELLFGAGAENWQWQISMNYKPFLLAALPPGAFVFMGCLIAAKNYIDQKQQNRKLKQDIVMPEKIRLVGFGDV